MEPLHIQFASNIASIIIVVFLVISFLRHKKRIGVIQKLDELKNDNQLTTEDISYIKENLVEYKAKAQKAEAFVKLLNPLFILAVGALFILLPTSDAMIHLNVVVVAFIFVQLDKINKQNTHSLLKELNKGLVKEEN